MGKMLKMLSIFTVAIIGTYVFVSSPIGRVDNESLVNQYKINEKKKLAAMAYAESQNDNYGLRVNNAPRPLYTPTYDGSNQAVHPKVLYFKNGWNGYKYWMGLTPYPYTNDDYENPQILVSNDGVKFKSPKKNNKPLFVPKDVKRGGHYSDIHLCLVGDTLEVYFRYNPAKTEKNQPDNHKNYIYVTKSKDGLNWTDKKLVLDNGTFKTKCAYLSPIINFENGKYKIWFTNYDGNLYYTETLNWKNFKELKKCNFVGRAKNLKIWHQDLIKTDIGYEFVCCAYGEVFLNQNLYYASSDDGINFKPLKKIMEPTDKVKTFDEKTLYRPSLVKRDGQYLLYYSAMDSKLRWHIGLSKDTKGIKILDEEYDNYLKGEIKVKHEDKKSNKKMINNRIRKLNNDDDDKNINNADSIKNEEIKSKDIKNKKNSTVEDKKNTNTSGNSTVNNKNNTVNKDTVNKDTVNKDAVNKEETNKIPVNNSSSASDESGSNNVENNTKVK